MRGRAGGREGGREGGRTGPGVELREEASILEEVEELLAHVVHLLVIVFKERENVSLFLLPSLPPSLPPLEPYHHERGP